MKNGLDASIMQQMQGVFSNYPSIDRVILFGSRAMQTHRIGSDIDLALESDKLTWDELLDIQIQLDELGYLYKFDVKDLKRIQNPELLDHIHRVGDVVYNTKK